MKASPSLGSSLSFMDESNRVISNDIGEAAANRALHCQKKEEEEENNDAVRQNLGILGLQSK